ncbi:hypothetical protein BaRGS_00012980 [Batillaria attramentaria]|uniref:Uncharacterized protein n=1 Tax=Batillaria attramentaria TaxID=370345 RepID=A0ABD0L995_9CAEN
MHQNLERETTNPMRPAEVPLLFHPMTGESRVHAVADARTIRCLAKQTRPVSSVYKFSFIPLTGPVRNLMSSASKWQAEKGCANSTETLQNASEDSDEMESDDGTPHANMKTARGPLTMQLTQRLASLLFAGMTTTSSMLCQARFESSHFRKYKIVIRCKK